ncbi:hypothetical protein D3C73_1571730 [compost metagenome]
MRLQPQQLTDFLRRLEASTGIPLLDDTISSNCSDAKNLHQFFIGRTIYIHQLLFMFRYSPAAFLTG